MKTYEEWKYWTICEMHERAEFQGTDEEYEKRREEKEIAMSVPPTEEEILLEDPEYVEWRLHKEYIRKKHPEWLDRDF